MLRAAYSWLFTHVIRHYDPEVAHDAALTSIEHAGNNPVTRALMRATLGYAQPVSAATLPRKRQVYIGQRLVRHRLGLAAGMDKDARAVLGLTALGFGFVEVGTITPRPQGGNEAPRLWRLIESQSLRNRMGFNNEGALAAAQRLRQLRSTPDGRRAIVGVNIGKNKATPESDAAADYEYCAKILAPWADFVVVNVSSPNTPGLRDLQSADHLRPILLAALKGCALPDRQVPLFVKIAPDLSDADILSIVALVKDLGLAGIVATNTTTNHSYGEGGVSGALLRSRALDVVRLIADHLDDNHILIGAGGIFDVDDARAMLAAGADLVEAFTGFVFNGPAWPGYMNRHLARARA